VCQPDPILEKRTRRQLTAEYKLHIHAQADADKHGEPGTLLRQQKRYRNQLSDWHQEFAQNGVKAPSKSVYTRRNYGKDKQPAKRSRARSIQRRAGIVTGAKYPRRVMAAGPIHASVPLVINRPSMP